MGCQLWEEDMTLQFLIVFYVSTNLAELFIMNFRSAFYTIEIHELIFTSNISYYEFTHYLYLRATYTGIRLFQLYP